MTIEFKEGGKELHCRFSFSHWKQAFFFNSHSIKPSTYFIFREITNCKNKIYLLITIGNCLWWISQLLKLLWKVSGNYIWRSIEMGFHLGEIQKGNTSPLYTCELVFIISNPFLPLMLYFCGQDHDLTYLFPFFPHFIPCP